MPLLVDIHDLCDAWALPREFFAQDITMAWEQLFIIVALVYG